MTSRHVIPSKTVTLQDLKHRARKTAPRYQKFKIQRPKNVSKQMANDKHKSFLKRLIESKDKERLKILENELAKNTSNENKKQNIN